MSQNDLIVVDTTKFTVTHADAETIVGNYLKRKFKSLRAAIKYAKELQDEVEPEYGIVLI